MRLRGKTGYRGIFFVLLVLFLAGCATATDNSRMAQGYMQISQEEAKEMMENDDGHVIVDVRRQDEYDTGHIPGATLIPNESIGTEQPKELPDLDQIILIYCRSGNRSKQAAEKLSSIGYTNIYEFGGINTWTGDIVMDDANATDATSQAEDDGGITSDTDTVHAPVQAYVAFLDEQLKEAGDYSKYNEDCAIALVHLDDDDIPELVMIEGDSHGHCPVYFGYDGSSVIELGGYGSSGWGLYEPRKGTALGYYSNFGTTIFSFLTRQNGTSIEERTVSVTDLSAVPSGQEGYEFYDSRVDDNISQEEFFTIITPFLPENRQYKTLSYSILSKIKDADRIENTLIESLDAEKDYPDVDMEGFYNGVLSPELFQP